MRNGIIVGVLLTASVNAGLGQTAKFVSESKILNIEDYGAFGDGVTLNTEALQKTIDACHAAGGGVVWVPAGDFVIGTVHLKSHVTLSLDYGASLLGSQDWADYPTDTLRRAREGQSECLLYAEDATNIRLEGLGVIDGRGTPEAFPKRRPGGRGDRRPRLLRFEGCENLTFSGLTIRARLSGDCTWSTARIFTLMRSLSVSLIMVLTMTGSI